MSVKQTRRHPDVIMSEKLTRRHPDLNMSDKQSRRHPDINMSDKQTNHHPDLNISDKRRSIGMAPIVRRKKRSSIKRGDTKRIAGRSKRILPKRTWMREKLRVLLRAFLRVRLCECACV